MSLYRLAATVFPLLCLSACSPGLESSNSDLGRPCSLEFEPGASQAAYNPNANECTGSICLKPIRDNPEDRLTDPYCATTCAGDGDCQGQRRDGNNPNDHRCTQGYACAVPFVVGPLCCQKLCVCKDFLSERGAVTPPSCTPGSDGNVCGNL